MFLFSKVLKLIMDQYDATSKEQLETMLGPRTNPVMSKLRETNAEFARSTEYLSLKQQRKIG